jgi:integrase
MRHTLTEDFIRKVAPPAKGRLRVWCTKQPSFCLTVTPGGHRALYAAGRLNGKLTWTKIGDVGVITLVEARQRAKVAQLAMQRGEPPKIKPEPKPAKTTQVLTFAKLARQYQEQHCEKLRNYRRISADIDHLVREWGSRPAADISRGDVLELLDRVRVSRGPGAARNTVFGALAPMMTYACERDLLKASPCFGLRMTRLLGAKVARERVLSPGETRAVWSSLLTVDANFATVVKLLLLTGCRRSEIADLRWSEVSFGERLITIPAERMKAGKAHQIPMSPLVVELLRAVPRRLHQDRVFPTFRFALQKQRLDAASGVQNYVLHDLRRTLRTGLAELGVDATVAERVLAHVPGGIIAVYDRASYRDRVREALERWERHLLSIVEAQQAA